MPRCRQRAHGYALRGLRGTIAAERRCRAVLAPCSKAWAHEDRRETDFHARRTADGGAGNRRRFDRVPATSANALMLPQIGCVLLALMGHGMCPAEQGRGGAGESSRGQGKQTTCGRKTGGCGSAALAGGQQWWDSGKAVGIKRDWGQKSTGLWSPDGQGGRWGWKGGRVTIFSLRRVGTGGANPSVEVRGVRGLPRERQGEEERMVGGTK